MTPEVGDEVEAPELEAQPGDDPGDSQDPGGQPTGASGDSPARGDTRDAGNEPTPGKVGPAAKVRADLERWGDLPPTVRDVFRTGGGLHMPSRYRGWIDAYYRRLNASTIRR